MLTGISASLSDPTLLVWSYKFREPEETFTPIHGGFQYSQGLNCDYFTVLTSARDTWKSVDITILKATPRGMIVNVGTTTVPWHRVIEWVVSTITRNIGVESREVASYKRAAYMLIAEKILQTGDFGTKEVKAYEERYGRPFEESRSMPDLYEDVFDRVRIPKAVEKMLATDYEWTSLPDFTDPEPHVAMWCRDVNTPRFFNSKLNEIAIRIGGTLNLVRCICAYRAMELAECMITRA